MKTPVLDSVFNKVADMKTCHFIKKRLKYMFFPVNIQKFLRKVYFIEYHQWLFGPLPLPFKIIIEKTF